MHRSTALVLVLVSLAITTSAAAGPPPDGVWVNGSAHTLVTGPPPAGTTHGRPLYVIAPVSTAHPLHPLATARLHGFGAHDHVFARAPFKGVCDLHLVVPGPNAKPGTSVALRKLMTPAGAKPLLYAAKLGGKMVALDRTSRIQQAAKAKLATIVDTHTLLACTIAR